MTETQFEGNSPVNDIPLSSTPGRKIFCDYRLDDESLTLLRDGVAPHQIIFPRKAAVSVLENPAPDPAFLEADITFGQPDVNSILESSRLRWVQLTSAGYMRYDTPEFRSAAQARGLRLTNSSSVFAEACAEHIFAFMLAQARQLPLGLRTRVPHSSGDWAKLRNACSCLKGHSVVILGFGTIAARLVELLAPVRMKISVMRREPRGDEPVATFVPDDLRSHLMLADHVVDILPDNADSRGFISAERLGWMKPGAIFYNIGRGTTVDQEALRKSLESGQLGAAWLDVTEPEPLPDGHPLLGAPNCFITPHIAGGHGHEARSLVLHFLENFRLYLENAPLRDRIF
jgi:phosphoglycerate dehydrogenase-like enzyme